MADLPKEYEAIRKQTIERAMSSNHPVVAGNMIDAVREAVERCYALHNQPPKELTQAERDAVLAKHNFGSPEVVNKMLDDILAAYIAKQREPDVVEFRAARCLSNPSLIEMANLDDPLPNNWEWLEPAQTFKVVV